jgi:succinate--hydroxymethylglutarate CoA-transferase
MHITGHRDAPPAKVGVAVTDLTTGLYTSNSILASLLQRAITGQGQWIDISLSDCQVATLSNLASSHLISGKPDSGRWGTAHPSIVPYKGFETKDGSIMLGGGNDRLFGVLCDRLEMPEWKLDPKFVTNAKRVENRDLLEELITTITKQKDTEEWLEIFEGSGMPYAAVNDIAGTMKHEHGISPFPQSNMRLKQKTDQIQCLRGIWSRKLIIPLVARLNLLIRLSSFRKVRRGYVLRPRLWVNILGRC